MNHQDAGSAELIPGAPPQPGGSAVPDGSLAPGASVVPGASVLPGGSEVRGGPEWRQLSFRASGLTIELEITGGGEYRRLVGQLIPRQSAAVDIRHGQGVITVAADTLGRFSADEVPFGQISLRCRLGSDQSPVVTGWITL